MNTQLLMYIFLLCILKVLHYCIANYDSDSMLSLKTYLKSLPGLKLTSRDKTLSTFYFYDRGLIPYFTDPLSFDKSLRNEIRKKLNEINFLTDLKFTEAKNAQLSRIIFINRINKFECEDYTVNEGQSVRKMILGYDCLARGVAVPKAVLQILGIPPEHNSYRRDDFIKIDTSHILEEKKKYFEKFPSDDFFKNFEYDYASVSHYSNFQHTADGHETVIPNKTHLMNLKVKIGEATTYSIGDLEKIVRIYKTLIQKRKPENTFCDNLFEPANYSEPLKVKDEYQPPKSTKQQLLAEDDQQDLYENYANDFNETVNSEADYSENMKNEDTKQSDTETEKNDGELETTKIYWD